VSSFRPGAIPNLLLCLVFIVLGVAAGWISSTWLRLVSSILMAGVAVFFLVRGIRSQYFGGPGRTGGSSA
jgi:hypothetical protein